MAAAGGPTPHVHQDYGDIYKNLTTLSTIKSGNLSNNEKNKLLDLTKTKMSELEKNQPTKFTNDEIALIAKLTGKKGGLKKASNKLLDKLQNLFSSTKGSKAINYEQTKLQTQTNATIQKLSYDSYVSKISNLNEKLDEINKKSVFQPLIEQNIITADTVEQMHKEDPIKKHLELANATRQKLETAQNDKKINLDNLKSLTDSLQSYITHINASVFDKLKEKIGARETELEHSIENLEKQIDENKEEKNHICRNLDKFFERNNIPIPDTKLKVKAECYFEHFEAEYKRRKEKSGDSFDALNDWASSAFYRDAEMIKQQLAKLDQKTIDAEAEIGKIQTLQETITEFKWKINEFGSKL